MKKFAFTTTVVLGGLAHWASAAADPANSANTTPPTTPPAACCTKDGSCQPCQSPCSQGDKGIQCDEDAWLDIETVTVEAENGDPIAQYTVAYLIETAEPPSDDAAAKSSKWYTKALPGLEKAAAEGHPSACLALAHMYAMGKGVEKNPEMAAKYKKMYQECCKKKAEKRLKADKKDCCPANTAPQQN